MKYEKDMNVYVQLVIKGQTVKVIINSENVILGFEVKEIDDEFRKVTTTI